MFNTGVSTSFLWFYMVLDASDKHTYEILTIIFSSIFMFIFNQLYQ